MAQNTDIVLTAGTWTQLTDANVTSITFQNRGLKNTGISSDYYMLIKCTTDTTAPTSDDGAVRYDVGQGERNVSLSDLFPGISAVRVWAYSPEPVEVMVSHA